MATDTLPPDSCLECGACCFGDGPRYLRVTGHDHGRLGTARDLLTHFIGNCCYMRLADGHCASLAIKLSEPSFACSSYATRPETCRELKRGSRECLAEYDRKRARAQDAIEKLRQREISAG